MEEEKKKWWAVSDVGAWAMNVVSSVGIIMANKQLMSPSGYAFAFGSVSLFCIFFLSLCRHPPDLASLLFLIIVNSVSVLMLSFWCLLIGLFVILWSWALRIDFCPKCLKFNLVDLKFFVWVVHHAEFCVMEWSGLSCISFLNSVFSLLLLFGCACACNFEMLLFSFRMIWLDCMYWWLNCGVVGLKLRGIWSFVWRFEYCCKCLKFNWVDWNLSLWSEFGVMK